MDALEKEFYTYEDYCKFNDDKRREIINGVIYLMTAPNREHQKILGNLYREISVYLKGKKCEVYPAPLDVRLPKEGETKKNVSTTVQPDIVVICDKNKLDKRGCFGTPDLVIEILSPSTGRMDRVKKLNLYQEHGIPEYWIADPVYQTLDIFSFDEKTGKYKSTESFGREDIITSVLFPDFKIELTDVFPPSNEYDDE